jgi:hypothetical protein
VVIIVPITIHNTEEPPSSVYRLFLKFIPREGDNPKEVHFGKICGKSKNT